MKTTEVTAAGVKAVPYVLDAKALGRGAWAALCKRIEHDPNHSLKAAGAGSQGRIFLLDSKRVLKITADKSEGVAAKIIKQHPNKNVYECLDVFPINGLTAIVMERFGGHVPEAWYDFADLVLGFYNDEQVDLVHFDPQKFQHFEHWLDQREHEGPSSVWTQQLKWLKEVSTYLKEVGIKISVNELMTNFSSRSNGDIIAADIGYATIQGAQPVVSATTDEKFNDAFWKWFGQSKCVDEQGKPLVVYHGTSKDMDFKSFKLPKRGVFFTPNKDDASNYAVENDSKDTKYDHDKREWRDVNTSGRVIPCYLSIQNPWMVTDAEWAAWPKKNKHYTEHENGYMKMEADMADWARAQGYDGIVRSNVIWIVIKDQGQIKSAIGNKGTWDRTKKDITAATEQLSLEEVAQYLKDTSVVYDSIISDQLAPYPLWQYVEWPASKFNIQAFQGNDDDEDRVIQYGDMGWESMPPCVAVPSEMHPGEFDLVDGNHRAMACADHGWKVPAFVPAQFAVTASTNVDKVGALIRKWAASNSSYKVLDKCPDINGCTWMEGGCLVLAQALQQLLPGSQLAALMSVPPEADTEIAQHAGVLWQGKIIDALGAHTELEWLHYWEYEEDLESPYILPGHKVDWGEIPASQKSVKLVKQALTKLLGAVVTANQEADAVRISDEALKTLGLSLKVTEATSQVSVLVKSDTSQFSVGKIIARKVLLRQLEDEVRVGVSEHGADPSWAIYSSELDSKYHDKGIGSLMYETIIEALQKKHPDGFWLMPHENVEDGGHTSEDAHRVWHSLSKRSGAQLVTFHNYIALWFGREKKAVTSATLLKPWELKRKEAHIIQVAKQREVAENFIATKRGPPEKMQESLRFLKQAEDTMKKLTDDQWSVLLSFRLNHIDVINILGNDKLGPFAAEMKKRVLGQVVTADTIDLRNISPEDKKWFEEIFEGDARVDIYRLLDNGEPAPDAVPNPDEDELSLEQYKDLKRRHDLQLYAVADMLLEIIKLELTPAELEKRVHDWGAGRQHVTRAAREYGALSRLTGGRVGRIRELAARADQRQQFDSLISDSLRPFLRVQITMDDTLPPGLITQAYFGKLVIGNLDRYRDTSPLTGKTYSEYIPTTANGLKVEEVEQAIHDRKEDWPQGIRVEVAAPGLVKLPRFWQIILDTDLHGYVTLSHTSPGGPIEHVLNRLEEEVNVAVRSHETGADERRAAEEERKRREEEEIKKSNPPVIKDIPKDASSDQLALLRLFELKGVDQIPSQELRKSPLYRFPYVKDLVDRNKIITPDLVKQTPAPQPITDTLKWLRDNAQTDTRPFNMHIQRIWPGKPNFSWIMAIGVSDDVIMDENENIIDLDQATPLFGPEATEQLRKYAKHTNHPSLGRDLASIGWVRYTVLENDIWVDEIQTDLFKSKEVDGVEHHVLNPEHTKKLGSMPAVNKMLAERFIADMRSRGFQRFFWPGIKIKRDMYKADPPESAYEDLPNKLRFQRTTTDQIDNPEVRKLFSVDPLKEKLAPDLQNLVGKEPFTAKEPVWVLARTVQVLSEAGFQPTMSPDDHKMVLAKQAAKQAVRKLSVELYEDGQNHWPQHPGDAAQSATSASYLAKLLTQHGAQIWGYDAGQNPAGADLVDGGDGHNFCVLPDGTIVDWWAVEYGSSGSKYLVTPDDPDYKRYGDPSTWVQI